jgi:hypothetical protein
LVIQAMRDPEGNRLERVQVIKGWLDADGAIREKVYDVAGEVHSGADSATCAPAPGGVDSLCTVWADPAFDPAQSAFYYVRVLEVESCRWSTLKCNVLPEGERPMGCDSKEIQKLIRERAWSSPIWYTPAS